MKIGQKNIWQRYGQKYVAYFFGPPYICWLCCQFSPVMATVLRTLERGWQWEDRQCSRYHQYGKAKLFLHHKSQAAKSTGLVGSNLWEWRLDPSQESGEIYWSFRNVVLQKKSVEATQDEWVDFVQVKSWQRTSRSCEIIKVGVLRSYDTEILKYGEGNRSRMCTGYRNHGRQRRRWTDDIAEWTGMKINEVASAAEDRDHWYILRAANPSYGGRHWTTTT